DFAREIAPSKIKGFETTPARAAPGNLRRTGVARRYYLEHRYGRLLRDRSNQYFARDAQGDAVRARGAVRAARACANRRTSTLVIVEGKTRTREDFGRPVEAVNAAKRKLISRGALAWLQLLDNPDILVRFDVVEIVLAEDGQPRFELIRGAFPLPAPYIY